MAPNISLVSRTLLVFPGLRRISGRHLRFLGWTSLSTVPAESNTEAHPPLSRMLLHLTHVGGLSLSCGVCFLSFTFCYLEARNSHFPQIGMLPLASTMFRAKSGGVVSTPKPQTLTLQLPLRIPPMQTTPSLSVTLMQLLFRLRDWQMPTSLSSGVHSTRLKVCLSTRIPFYKPILTFLSCRWLVLVGSPGP